MVFEFLKFGKNNSEANHEDKNKSGDINTDAECEFLSRIQDSADVILALILEYAFFSLELSGNYITISERNQTA
jgi:hypothetical protein